MFTFPFFYLQIWFGFTPPEEVKDWKMDIFYPVHLRKRIMEKPSLGCRDSTGTCRLFERHDLVPVSTNRVSAGFSGSRTRGSTEFNNLERLHIKQRQEQGIVESNPEAGLCQEVVILAENPSNPLSQKILCFILPLDFELVQGFRWRKLRGLD